MIIVSRLVTDARLDTESVLIVLLHTCSVCSTVNISTVKGFNKATHRKRSVWSAERGIGRPVSEATTPVSTTWNDPDICPFCDGQLTGPGAGSVDHPAPHPACVPGFDARRDRVIDDVGGGWSGWDPAVFGGWMGHARVLSVH